MLVRQSFHTQIFVCSGSPQNICMRRNHFVQMRSSSLSRFIDSIWSQYDVMWRNNRWGSVDFLKYANQLNVRIASSCGDAYKEWIFLETFSWLRFIDDKHYVNRENSASTDTDRRAVLVVFDEKLMVRLSILNFKAIRINSCKIISPGEDLFI